MGKKATYFRTRRIAAAELVRLHEDGHQVHAEALKWAKESLDASDDIGGREAMLDRAAFVRVLAAHAGTGATGAEVAAALGLQYRQAANLLYSLRRLGQIGSVRVGKEQRYFATPAAAALVEAELKRTHDERQRKRKADEYERSKDKRKKAAQDRRQNAAPAKAAPAKTAKRAAAGPTVLPRRGTTVAQAKEPVDVHVVNHPQGVKRIEQPTPLVLVDRWGVEGPYRGAGFVDEWLQLRAGGGGS